jgi:hypothetical protein
MDIPQAKNVLLETRLKTAYIYLLTVPMSKYFHVILSEA